MHFLLCISLLFFKFLNGQPINQNICPAGLISKPDDERWPLIPQKFEIMGELVLNDGALEITQIFSYNRDTVYLTINGVVFKHYYDFSTNEYLTISTFIYEGLAVPLCARVPITNQFPTSNISSTILKPSILLGYDRNNMVNNEFATRYDGETIINGLPVSIFRSCFYVSDIQVTVNATYYFTNPWKFQSYLGQNKSLLLQIDVLSETGSGEKLNYIYNIVRYLPNPSSDQERQLLETPAGVFCLNRTNTKNLPKNFPLRMSINTETSIIQTNNTSIYSDYQLVDEQLDFVRIDYYSHDRHSRDIFDYSTGLYYKYLPQIQQCIVSNLSAEVGISTTDQNRTYVRMKTITELLLLDNITQYHYTGIKNCHDRVQCDVWIGQKSVNNITEQFEWYWAREFDGNQLEEVLPIKLYITITPENIIQRYTVET
ncbi:unnamed protein product, partial [Didymodactylos carnosus]